MEKFGNDLERFVENEGLIIRRVDFLPEHTDAALYHDMIALKKNETPLMEKLYILHELGHHFLHSLCIGYYQSDLISILKFEKEAETFAALVLFPSIESFETEQDFINQCGLPPKTAKLRINFFRRNGI